MPILTVLNMLCRYINKLRNLTIVPKTFILLQQFYYQTLASNLKNRQYAVVLEKNLNILYSELRAKM